VPARGIHPVAWRLALAAVFLWLIYAYVEVPAVAGHLTADSLWAMLAMQPLLAAGYAVTAARLSALAGAASFGRALKAVILCYGLNLIVPARLSELIKVAYLREHGKLPASDCLAAVFVERALDAIMLGTIAVIAASLLIVEVSRFSIAAMAVAAAGLLSLPALAPLLVRAVRRLPLRSLAPFAERFLAQTTRRVRGRSIRVALALSAVIWIVSAASVYVFLRVALGDRIGLPDALLVLAAVIAGASIPGLPGNFGTFEAGGVLALRFLGFGLEEALAVSLALHVGQIFLASLLTVILLMIERTGVASLVRSASDALRRS
jgi:uncharacterized membrane protein YbhN (UPF0104 family)